MFSFNVEALTSAVKRIFKLKKFANVEFTAKQAFEDFDLAMLWLQFFLILAIIGLIFCSVIGIRKLLQRRAFHRAEVLLTRLSSQASMQVVRDSVSKDQEVALEMGRKETLSLLVKQIQKRRVEKILGERHTSLILLMLNHMAKHEVTEKSLGDHLVMIGQIARSLKVLQR